MKFNLCSLTSVEKFYLDSKRLRVGMNLLTFCFLEKNSLNISKRLEPEEVLTYNGHLAEFRNLNITTVKLDELLFKSPDINPK